MKTFSNKIYKSLKESKSISLKILLEEDEDKKSADDKSGDEDSESKDLFSDPSLEDDSEGSGEEGGDSAESDAEETSDLDVGMADDSADVKPEDIEKAGNDLKRIMKDQEKLKQSAESSSVEGSIDAYATAEVLKHIGTEEMAESYYRKSLKNFIFEAPDEDEERKAQEEKLKDAQKKVDDYVEGQTINVNGVVDSMENAINHFTKLFDINRIVYEKFAKAIVDYCGGNAEEYLQQIKDELSDRGYMGDYAKETSFKTSVGALNKG